MSIVTTLAYVYSITLIVALFTYGLTQSPAITILLMVVVGITDLIYHTGILKTFNGENDESG